jgi:hypothetical protein
MDRSGAWRPGWRHQWTGETAGQLAVPRLPVQTLQSSVHHATSLLVVGAVTTRHGLPDTSDVHCVL